MLHLMVLAVLMPLLAPVPAASRTSSPGVALTRIPTAAPTRVVAESITLPASGANGLMHDFDDVVSVSASIIIENTDLTSLAGWFPNLVDVTGNVQISNNAALTTMDASFQKLESVSGNLDIFGNGALVELGSALPFPGSAGLVTGYVSIYNNPVLLSLGAALEGLVTITGYCSVYGNAELATLDTAFDDLVTVTGYLSIYANPELASLGAAFSNLVTVTGYTSFANNPSLLCALDVGSRVVIQTGACQLSAAPTGPTNMPLVLALSTTAPTAVPTVFITYVADGGSANSPDKEADLTAVVVAVILILLCLCAAALFLIRDMGQRQRDEAKASQARMRMSSVMNPGFTSGTVQSMRFGAIWEQGTNLANLDVTSSATDVYVSNKLRRSSSVSITSTTSVESTCAATMPRRERQRRMTDWGDRAEVEARPSSDSAVSEFSAMSVDSTATDWDDGAGDGLVVKTLAMSGKSRASLVSTPTVFEDDPNGNGNGGTLDRMHEPIREGSEMLDGGLVACLASDATAGGSLFSAERAHQPAGEQNAPSDTRTAVNSIRQPQAVINPKYQVPSMEWDEHTSNRGSYVEVESASDHYLEVVSGNTVGSRDTDFKVAPDEGASAYGTLGFNTSRPDWSSGDMYATLGAPAPGNTAVVASAVTTSVGEAYQQAAVRFDGNGADYDYEALPNGNYDYEIPSANGTSGPESDITCAEPGVTTATISTCPAPAQPSAAGGGARSESDDGDVELGATAAVGCTHDVLTQAAAVAGKADDEKAALLPPADMGVDMEQQLGGNGTGSFYSAVPPIDLKTAGHDSPAALDDHRDGLWCLRIETEKRLRATKSSPDCEEPGGQPAYEDPMSTESTYILNQNHYDGVPRRAAVGHANGLRGSPVVPPRNPPGGLSTAAVAGDPDPTYATPGLPASGTSSASCSVRGFTPEYAAPPEYRDSGEDDYDSNHEYASVGGSSCESSRRPSALELGESSRRPSALELGGSSGESSRRPSALEIGGSSCESSRRPSAAEYTLIGIARQGDHDASLTVVQTENTPKARRATKWDEHCETPPMTRPGPTTNPDGCRSLVFG